MEKVVLSFNDLVRLGLFTSRCSAMRWVDDGTFPPPFKLVGGLRWLIDDVIAWIDGRADITLEQRAALVWRLDGTLFSRFRSFSVYVFAARLAGTSDPARIDGSQQIQAMQHAPGA